MPVQADLNFRFNKIQAACFILCIHIPFAFALDAQNANVKTAARF